MKIFFGTILILISNFVFAQNSSFTIALEPVNIATLDGIQSYAYGQAAGKWLIIGGRKDGLHQRQPFAAFDASGLNTDLTVVDPVTMQKWTAPLSSLSVDLQEQLSSTNMEFHQDGNYLYLIGGYGYSTTMNDHITYSKLCAVDVPNVINAITNNQSFTSYFRQYADTNFAVTGGHLNKINDTYYLVGGQNFIGRYNPMGPNHGPGFFQQYTNQIRKFTLIDNGVSLTISNYQTITDSLAFHRRDYNVVEQILQNGNEGLTVFSGVFQTAADIPYLNAVNIDSNSYSINNSFAQYYNHYHCAVLPLYSQSANEMNNVFFGGIAQYYDSAGVLVQDNNVPFVKTIANVKRDNSGNMTEYKLNVEMPALLGSGSEFIANENIATFKNGVIKYDSLIADTTHVGYIFGGINSTAANIFWINTGIESSASNQLFKVLVIKNNSAGISQLNHQSNNGLQLQVYPNPNDGYFFIKFSLKKAKPVHLLITDANGKEVVNENLMQTTKGENIIEYKIKDLTIGGVYWVTLTDGDLSSAQQIIVAE